MPSPISPLLPTTVVGSYSVPHWLERLKTDYYRGQISELQLESIHEMAIKAALKDQELAGIDIVSDGELRRDNDVDYLLGRIPGVRIPVLDKEFYFEYYDAVVTSALPQEGTASLGLADEFTFTQAHTDRPIKFSFTGPFALACRIRDERYSDRADLIRALARILNAEAHRLAEAGATMLQIDEPFLAGYPDAIGIAVEAVNIVTEGVDVHWGLHVCYGNRYARPSWEGHYDFLFPSVHEANVDQLTLEFARKGYDDLKLIARSGWDREIGLGVIDVKSREIETCELVESRIRRTLDLFPPERVYVNPDCGLRHLPAEVAQAKLQTMVQATRNVRAELVHTADIPPNPLVVETAAEEHTSP